MRIVMSHEEEHRVKARNGREVWQRLQRAECAALDADIRRR
jgi:hypothetical protein